MLDKSLELFNGINAYLTSEEGLPHMHMIMIFCSALMDVMILTLFFHWFWYGDSMRMPIVYGAFYLLRVLCM